MKKNTDRRSRTRLQSLPAAQLAQVTGGATMAQLADSYAEGTGWHEFFAAADAASGYTCTPRY